MNTDESQPSSTERGRWERHTFNAPMHVTSTFQRLSRRVALWLAVLLPFLWLTAQYWPYEPFPGDYAQYLLHAKALLEGKGYTDTGYIYSPLSAPGPAAYPPGIPVALYLLFSAFGWHIQLGQLLMLACAVAFFILAERYFAEGDDARMAIAIPLAVSVSAQVAQNSVQIMSDLPFCAMCWGVFVLADRREAWSSRTIAGMCVVGSLAILTRSAGVVLVPAMLLYWLINVRHRRHAPLIVAGVWALTFWYTARSFPTLGSYATFYAGADTTAAAARASVDATVGASTSIASRLLETLTSGVQRLLAYRSGILESFLYPFPAKRANQAYHLLALGIMAVGLAAWVRHAYRRFLTIFVLGYVALLSFYPYNDIRYLWPIVPFLAFGVLRGVAIVVARIRPAWPVSRRHAVVLGTFAAGSIALFAHTAAAPRERSLLEYPAARELFAYARREHAREPQRWSVFNSRVFTLHTRVAAMSLLNEEPAIALAELARLRITHVVVGAPVPSHGSTTTQALVASHPELFTLEYRNAVFAVYRVRHISAGQGASS